MGEYSGEQGSKEVVIRTGYVADCGRSLVRIRQIKIVQLTRGSGKINVEINLVSNVEASFSVRVDEVDLLGVPFEVERVTVNLERGSMAYVLPVNFGVVENTTTTTPFVYLKLGEGEGLECRENLNLETPSVELIIGKVQVYPLEGVRVTRFRSVNEHGSPFSVEVTAEYTVVNYMPFPIRFLYADLQRYVKGLEVRDGEGRTLRFLTRQELREVFGEDVIDRLNEFFVVVDLGEVLEPGEAKVLRLVGAEEISETRDYSLRFRLIPNVTEGVVIKPPHGYEVVISREDIVAVRDVSDETEEWFKDRSRAKPLFAGNDGRKSVKLDPNLRLDRFVNPGPKEGSNEIRSTAVVDMQFRLYYDYSTSTRQGPSEEPLFRDPVEDPGIAIRYSLEVQHKSFWNSLLTFFSVLVFSLFFQELFYDLALGLDRLYRPVLPFLSYDFTSSFALTLVLGSAIGYLYAARNGLTRGLGRLLDSSLMMLVYSLSVAIIAVDAVTSFGPTVHAIISKLGGFYVELEFAILVAVELAYFLAERAVRDEYRGVLLILTALTLVSVLLLIPWIALGC